MIRGETTNMKSQLEPRQSPDILSGIVLEGRAIVAARYIGSDCFTCRSSGMSQEPALFCPVSLSFVSAGRKTAAPRIAHDKRWSRLVLNDEDAVLGAELIRAPRHIGGVIPPDSVHDKTVLVLSGLYG